MKMMMMIFLSMVLGTSVAFGRVLFPREIGSFEVVEDDFVYADIDGLKLLAHSYRPKTDGILHGVVEVHGGAWNYYDRMAGHLYNKALASAGLYVLAVDFRQGPAFKHPLASRDVTAGVRYLKTHAERLNLRPDTVGLIGSSSGGHLALLAGIRPDADLHAGTPILLPDGSASVASSPDARVKYVIALWPVSDPFYRYEYAKKSGQELLAKAHDGYFAHPEDMKDASIADVIRRGDASHLPAVLVVQPGKDTNIPLAMTFDMMHAFQHGGGYVDYAFYPDQPHAFAHKPGKDTDDCIRLMVDFIKRRLSGPEK